MENIISYVADSALILIPVIYIVGLILKGLQCIKDKYIPLILLPVGVALSMLIIGINVNGFIQGILVTGVAVYANQLFKQALKEE